MTIRRKAWLTLLERRNKKYERKSLANKLDKILSRPVPLEALAIIDDVLKDVPLAIIGGHAVTIHGQPRLTSDIDILINPSNVSNAVKRLNGTNVKPLHIGGVTFNSHGIDVDLIAPNKPWLSTAISSANETQYGRIVSKPFLVLTKLWSSRGEQDDTDIIGVIRNMSEEEIIQTRKLIKKHLPNDVDDLEQFINMKAL